MNKHLFELLRRTEDSARRLAATIMRGNDKRLRDTSLVEAEIKEISDALETFKSEVVSSASLGETPERPGRNARPDRLASKFLSGD
jgi:hypothetical protein